jgi:putative transposase
VPEILLSLLAAIRVFFRNRSDTALQVLALRQQVAVLKRKRQRSKLNRVDRLFWTALRHCWSRWTEVLVIVKPETVIGWRRAGFRLYWRWRSRPRGGRPKVNGEIRAPIQRLAQENPDWGTPRIHGELQKLGFVVAERSVARYLRRIRRRGDPARRWVTFLQNHREVIAAFDFFTVPTITFQLLYCFFVIEHRRRRILHFNVTGHPTAEWVVQQLREAFPEAGPYRYAIFDRDSTFNNEVVTFLKATGLEPKRTSVQAPWQNGIAERWVGSRRREILDHVIALNEPQARSQAATAAVGRNPPGADSAPDGFLASTGNKGGLVDGEEAGACRRCDGVAGLVGKGVHCGLRFGPHGAGHLCTMWAGRSRRVRWKGSWSIT